MTAKALRDEVLQYISHADERFLKMVYAMSKEYEDDVVVGYAIKGNAITKVELKDRVKAASKRVKSGNFIPHEDLEKEIEEW